MQYNSKALQEFSFTYPRSSLPAHLELSTKNVEQLRGEENMAYLNTCLGEE